MWHGILKVLEVQHWSAEGRLLWEQRNILNLLHQDGEEFLLRAAFMGGQNSTVIPDNYYLGLDNRSTLAVDQTMDDITGEPLGAGYQRQGVSSSGDFSINFEQNHFVVTSPIVAFRATSGSWGPVNNLFLTSANDDTGFLISSVKLDTAVSLSANQSVTMRIGMQLHDC